MKHSYFVIKSQQLICATITTKSSQGPQFFLQGLSKFDFGTPPLLEPLQRTIQSFLNKHQLQGSYAHVAFMHPLIFEDCIIVTTAQATKSDFIRHYPILETMLFHYTYLHPLEDGRHRYYICGVGQENLFFFDMLLRSCNVHIAQSTSSYIASLQTYKKLYQCAFRHAQLAADMAKTGYDLQQLFTNDSIARLLTIPSYTALSVQHDKEILLALIGITHMKESMYGN